MALSAWTRTQLDNLPTLDEGALQELDAQLTSDYELCRSLELTPDVVAELTELAVAIESVSKEAAARKAHEHPVVAPGAGIAVDLNAPVVTLDSHIEASVIAPPAMVPASPPPPAPRAPPADQVTPQAQPPEISVFISHVEENRATAEAIARGLEAAGYDAWSYESSSVPGPTYLSQVMDAIEKASAVILVISPEALGSHQVAREIEAAHELDRPIIPVLKGITHEKYLQRRPEWRLALGAYTSIEVPRDGVDAIIPKLVGGLEALGVARGEVPEAPPVRPGASLGSRTRHGLRAAVHRPWFMVLAGVLVTAVVVVGAVLLLGSGDGQTGKPVMPTTPTSVPADGAIPEVTQPLDNLKASLEVEPTTAYRDQTVAISYSITNTSDLDFKASTTSIVVLVGASPGGTGTVLSDISQDIGVGATVTGTVYGSLADATPGPQTVWIDVGQRFAMGTVGDVYPAEVPITVTR